LLSQVLDDGVDASQWLAVAHVERRLGQLATLGATKNRGVAGQDQLSDLLVHVKLFLDSRHGFFVQQIVLIIELQFNQSNVFTETLPDLSKFIFVDVVRSQVNALDDVVVFYQLN
jgi:hypothetical protein